MHLSPTFARSLDRDISLLDCTLQLTTQTIVNHVRLELENYQALAQRANINTLLLHLADLMQITLSQEESQKGIQLFRDTYGLRDDRTYKTWQQANDLTEEETMVLIKEWLLIKKVQNIKPIAQNNALLRQLRLEGLYPTLLEKVQAKETYFKEINATEEAQKMSCTELLAFWWKHQGREGEPPSLRTLASTYHFLNEDLLWRELLKYYVFVQNQKGTC